MSSPVMLHGKVILPAELEMLDYIDEMKKRKQLTRISTSRQLPALARMVRGYMNGWGRSQSRLTDVYTLAIRN